MLTSLVSLLPASAQPYAKTIAAALLSVLTVLSTSVDNVPGWVPIVIALLSAPAVFALPNLDPKAEKQDESVQPAEASLGDGVGAVGDLAAGVYSGDSKADAAYHDGH